MDVTKQLPKDRVYLRLSSARASIGANFEAGRTYEWDRADAERIAKAGQGEIVTEPDRN